MFDAIIVNRPAKTQFKETFTIKNDKKKQTFNINVHLGFMTTLWNKEHNVVYKCFMVLLPYYMYMKSDSFFHFLVLTALNLKTIDKI